MKVTSEILSNALKSCSLIFNNEQIPESDLMHSSIEFISNLMTNDDENRGLILHQGSVFYDVVIMIISAFSCILNDDTSHERIIAGLKPGDMVLYGKSRAVFGGIDEKNRAVIKQDGLMTFAPPNLFYKIRPYYGTATSLDGRGVRTMSPKRAEFISEIFNIKQENIPSITNRSVIIVCDKSIADRFVNETTIKYGDEQLVWLRDIFTASYYSLSDAYPYAGNSEKSDPVLKFTSKISVAREMIIDDDEKKVIGLFICGKKILDAGISELANLLTRRSLKFVAVSCRIDDGDHQILLNQRHNLKLFACTKDVLLSHKITSQQYYLGEETLRYHKFIDNVIDKEVVIDELSCDIGTEAYRTAKNALLRISNNEYSDDNTEYFVINAFSLLNLLTSSIFTMRDLEEQIRLKTIGILSPEEHIKKLVEISKIFFGVMGDDMGTVVTVLTKFHLSLYDENSKMEYLINKIISNFGRKKTAVIVPKAYYTTVFRYLFPEKDRSFLENCDITTAGKFDSNIIYDEIIVVGVFEGKSFRIFLTNCAPVINVISYPFEKKKFKTIEKETHKIIQLYNQRNNLEFDWDPNEEDNEDATIEQTVNDEIDIKIEEYIDRIIVKFAVTALNFSNIDNQVTTEIVRVATFETGETAFFTKNYCPYVFDAIKEDVIESEVEKLEPGDVLVFTKNNDQTKDIVENILNNLISSNKCEEKIMDAYRKSKYWKNVLKNYMTDHLMSYRDLSKQMKEYGSGKHQVTLRTWLDEDSHIVGPRDSESFYEIALITNDQKMLRDPDAYCEACNDIRSMRMRILKFVGLSIIKSLVNSKEEKDKLFQIIADDIGDLAITLQIEKIVDTHKLSVPVYLANRPTGIVN